MLKVDMSDITFSIVTVCKNPGASLWVTQESLQRQTYGNFEWVVIDGVSTDGTLEQLKLHPGVTTLVSEPDAGIYDAMNKGVRRAKGDFVFFLNAGDTFFDCTVLEQVAAMLALHPSDVLYGDAWIVEGEEKTFLRKHDRVDKIYLVTATITHQAVFAHRDLFHVVGEFDTRFKLKADHDWIVRCWNAGKTFRYLPIAMVRYPNDGYSKLNRKKYIDAERKLFYQKNFSRSGLLLFRLAYKLKLVNAEKGWLRSWLSKVI